AQRPALHQSGQARDLAREAPARHRPGRSGLPLRDLHAPLARLPPPPLLRQGDSLLPARDPPQPHLLSPAGAPAPGATAGRAGVPVILTRVFPGRSPVHTFLMALAQAAPASGGGQPAGPAGCAGGGAQSLIFMLLMIAVFYFMLIRPQQKKAKEHNNFLGG